MSDKPDIIGRERAQVDAVVKKLLYGVERSCNIQGPAEVHRGSQFWLHIGEGRIIRVLVEFDRIDEKVAAEFPDTQMWK